MIHDTQEDAPSGSTTASPTYSGASALLTVRDDDTSPRQPARPEEDGTTSRSTIRTEPILAMATPTASSEAQVIEQRINKLRPSLPTNVSAPLPHIQG